MRFRKGESGNPGGRPRSCAQIQELARSRAPEVIAELGRLALKAKSETARISAIRELLDRGYGRSRQNMEISAEPDDAIRILLDLIDERERTADRERPTYHIPSRSRTISPVDNPFVAQQTKGESNV